MEVILILKHSKIIKAHIIKYLRHLIVREEVVMQLSHYMIDILIKVHTRVHFRLLLKRTQIEGPELLKGLKIAKSYGIQLLLLLRVNLRQEISHSLISKETMPFKLEMKWKLNSIK